MSKNGNLIFKNDMQKVSAQSVTELTSRIRQANASSKFKAALICAAGMSVDPATSVMRGNSIWP
ncbi:MAG: hypothetical protein CMK37_07615 [Porticoccaceae bacterium]|nr:hypothetical protein [Porticoccaceae bacterium]